MQATNTREVLTSLIGIYAGSVVIGEETYPSVEKAISALSGYEGQVSIILNRPEKKLVQSNVGLVSNEPEESKSTEYRIKVRQYMTKPASPSFDFQDKWNNGIPMPMRVMVGTIIKETKGMVKMELHGDIVAEQTSICMKCGKTLTNPVSRFFGIGPECGGHNYVNPFDTKEELEAAVAQVREQLKQVTWTGWIIKSAIEEQEVL